MTPASTAPEPASTPGTPEATAAPDPPEPIDSPSDGDGVGYVHLGCFKDSKAGRVLSRALESDDMTAQVRLD